MRKLMWFSLGFAAAAFSGVYFVSASFYLMAAGACALLLAICLAFMLRYPKMRIGAMILLGCILGFGWQLMFDSYYLSAPRAADGYQDSTTVYAVDYSAPTDYGRSVEGYVTLNGKYYKVKAYYAGEEDLAPGDRVTGRFRLGCTLPGGSLESLFYRSEGIFLIAYLSTEPEVSHSVSLPWYGYPAFVREGVSGIIDDSFPGETSAFAKALLLGKTEDLSYETDTNFKLSGIRHVIAVSGLHVTILFSVIYVLTGKRSVIASLIGIPVLIFFAAVAGFSPSITRACIMHGLMSIAMLLRKEYDPPTALSFAVLVMLLLNPWTAANVGFQLSVFCMVGIFLFAEPIQNWLMDIKRLGKFKGTPKKLCNWFSASVSVSIGAAILTTPLCAYYFGMVSLVSVLTNLLTLWVVTYIFYGILLACLLGLIWAPLGAGVGFVVSWMIRYVLLVADWMASLPFSAVYTESIFVVIWLVVSYILLAAYLLCKRKHPVILGCISTLLLCFALLSSWLQPVGDECRVTVLDVGQGQCVLLQSEGKNFLVDCGGDSDAFAADKAAALLNSQGIHRLDGLIITHFDADHAAGAVLLLSRVDADVLYLPETVDPDGYGQMLYDYDKGVVCAVSQDTVITFGQASITLYPSSMGQTDNESGLCILFQTQTCDILITGDRSRVGEWELLNHTALPELELLIVGHHGSKYSTSEELLAATTPQMAIISVSAYNSYGHPAQEVLDRLTAYDCEIFRTDRDGTVIFRR